MAVEIHERGAPGRVSVVHLIGPGGVGKSTVGALVAGLLGWPFLDLDVEFMHRIGHIGVFIRTHGYAPYQEANTRLADEMVRSGPRPLVAALSSGFLMQDRTPECGARNRALIRETGCSVLLMPSADIDEAAKVVVARQLGRGFGLDADRELEKFRSRFASYMALGDMQVFSSAPPAEIAAAIAARLGPWSSASSS